jgi:hypothetical protein
MIWKKYNEIINNYDEMDYYDNTGDLIYNYFESRDIKETDNKKTKDILTFLSSNKKNDDDNDEMKKINRAKLFENIVKELMV